MRLIIVFILLTFISCENKEKVRSKKNMSISEPHIQKQSLPKDLLESDNILEELNYIFDFGYEFGNGINVEKIGLLETSLHTYKVVFVLGNDTNFGSIQELLLGMIYYPSDPSLLELEIEREREYKKTAVKIDIKKMSDKYVFVYDEFKIVPKNHKLIRFYFYNKDEGIVGEELKLYNISFSPIQF